MTDDESQWNPKPAKLREGEGPSEEHAAWNLAMIRQAVRDGDLDPAALEESDG